MYEFIRTQWILRKVTAEWVQAQVPRWITQEQADAILATSQVPEGSAE
jgi:hypothetical protein